MYSSNVALLLLAATAAAPAFATPIYAPPSSAVAARLDTRDPNLLSTIWHVLNLRSEDGGDPLAMRDVDIAELLSGRDGQDELLDARGMASTIGNFVGKIMHLLPFAKKRDVALEELTARSLLSIVAPALKPLGLRDVAPEEELTARSLLSILAPALKPLGLRDVAPEELTARSLLSVLGPVLKSFGLRDIASEGLVARDFITSLDARDDTSDQLKALLLSRDVTPEQLASLINSRSFDDLD